MRAFPPGMRVFVPHAKHATDGPLSPQANMIPISWDRVFLYHLEEISPGVWQPVFSTS